MEKKEKDSWFFKKESKDFKEEEKERKVEAYSMKRLKREEIKEILKKGKVFKGKNLILKFLKAKENKISILVPKKVFKKAVLRNKFKRRLREIVREKFKGKDQNYHLFFIALPGVFLDFKILEKEVEKILKRAKIL